MLIFYVIPNTLHHKLCTKTISIMQLDYSFDLMLSEKEPLTREKFREKIYAGQPESIRDKEVDFLFDLLDYSDDGVIDKDDFNVAKLSS